MHHFKWSENHIITNASAYELIIIIEKYRLKRTLLVDIITWKKNINESTIDLTFVTSLLRENAINVMIIVNMNNCSNHYFIRIIFELRIMIAKSILKRNWEKIDTTILQKTLKKIISCEKNLTSMNDHDCLKNDINRQVQTFTKTIQKIIEVFTSWIKICSRSKSKFTFECKKISLTIKRAKRTWHYIKHSKDWRDYIIIKNRLNKVMKKVMKKQFHKKTKEDCESTQKIWNKCKWIRKRTMQKVDISILYNHFFLLFEFDSTKKSKILLKIFFSLFFTIIFTNIKSYVYSKSLKIDDIIFNEIFNAIVYITIKKISKENEIINDILKQINKIIVSHLHRIFNASLDENYCSKHFRNSITITLRKSQKNCYAISTTYRLITLFNIINKFMKYILIKRINYLTKTYNLLSITHMSARKAISKKHALHYVLKRAYEARNKNKILTTLLLNIMNVFNNVTRRRLLHNLKTKRINIKIIRWIENYLSNKVTIWKINEHITKRVNIKINISQKFSLSLILFFVL